MEAEEEGDGHIAELSFIETLQSETDARDAGAMTGRTTRDQGYGRRERTSTRMMKWNFIIVNVDVQILVSSGRGSD